MDTEILNDVKKYISVDYEDDDDLIKDEIEIAQIYIDECVGQKYKQDEKKVRLASLVLKMFVKYMYDNRSIVVPQNLKNSHIVTTILDVLENGD